MAYVVTQETLEALTEADQEALVSIYYHRCLDAQLLYQHYYSNEDPRPEHGEERISWLTQHGLITPVEYGEASPAYFLTALGVAAVRRIRVYPDRKNLSAAALKMKPQLIRHQMSLNAAALDIEAEAKERNIPYEYYDLKHMDYNGEVMPDGMFRFNEYDVFLEMDMNTEKAKHLGEKWQNYRSYLNSQQFWYNERKTVVLFLLCGVKRPRQRRSTVMASLGRGLLDKMASRFDIYVDEPEPLQRVLFDELLTIPSSVNAAHSALRQLGFTTSLAGTFNALLDGVEYGFYTRMLSHKTHKVVVKKKRPQEFLLDVETSGLSAAVLAKAAYHNSVTLPMAAKLGRSVPYLIVGGDERSINADLKAVDSRGMKNVYFTTLPRLQQGVTISEALFQIDQLGRVFHFADPAFSEPVYESNI